MKFFKYDFTNSQSTPTDTQALNYTSIFIMFVTMIIASIFSVFPLDELLANLRPLFMFVVMLFWVIHRPETFGITFVFCVGLTSDFLLDTRLGQQGFSAVLAVAIFQYATQNLKQLNDVILWLYASATIIIFSFTLLLLQFIDGQVIIWRNGLPMITTILSWPVVVFFLKRF